MSDPERTTDGYDTELGMCHKHIAELEQWVKDLQSGMYVNCVYCGHRYGPGETTPVSMADALKEHVETCPKHPMSTLKKRYTDLEAQLTVAQASIARKQALLKRFEYVPVVPGWHICPECSGRERHTSDCDLAAELKE